MFNLIRLAKLDENNKLWKKSEKYDFRAVSKWETFIDQLFRKSLYVFKRYSGLKV